MMKPMKGHIWLPVIILALVFLGIYFFFHTHQKQKRPLQRKNRAVEMESLPNEQAGPQGIEKVSPPGTNTVAMAPGKALTEENPCARTEKKVAEFFTYLDRQKYVQEMDLKTDTYTRFKKILKKLSDKPPIPAGETSDPEIIISNICHFFRILNNKDRRLILEIIRNEQESLEMDFVLFYRWFVLSERCPNLEGLRPSMRVFYNYAGFFINTTGGRAYLLRRTSTTRVLISYYCVLIIHQADETGKNTYGIDISPYVSSLRQEFMRYPDLKFYQTYIDQLDLIGNYYFQKRSPSE